MLTKVCSKCGKRKKIKRFRADERYSLKCFCWCKDCVVEYGKRPEIRARQKQRWAKYMAVPENRERERQRSREKYAKDPVKAKDQSYQRLYGVTLARFQRRKRCAVCNRKRKLCADHSHRTGLYRAPVCYPCNIVIGHIEALPGIVAKVSAYLRRHDGVSLH